MKKKTISSNMKTKEISLAGSSALNDSIGEIRAILQQQPESQISETYAAFAYLNRKIEDLIYNIVLGPTNIPSDLDFNLKEKDL